MSDPEERQFVDGRAEESSAERWLYEQASATWGRFLAGDGRTVPREEIQRIIAEWKVR